MNASHREERRIWLNTELRTEGHGLYSHVILEIEGIQVTHRRFRDPNQAHTFFLACADSLRRRLADARTRGIFKQEQIP